MFLLKRPLWLIFLLCAGCSAQPQSPQVQSSNADLNKRIEQQLRARYEVPADVRIEVGPRTASDIKGLDKLVITFSQGAARKTQDVYISSDNRYLFASKIDVSPEGIAAAAETARKKRLETMSKIDVAGRPVRGARDSKVAVVVYDDFQCPYCSRMHQTLFREVFKDYQDRVHVIYKDYPLYEIHPWAARAANDANCLAELNNDAFWDFADSVHFNPQQVTGSGGTKRPLAEAFVTLDTMALQMGAKRGVNGDRLQACIKAQSSRTVQDSVREAEAVGVSATPTLFINGRKLEGAIEASELRDALNDALQEAGQPVPAASGSSSAVHITPMPQAIPAVPAGTANK